MTAEKQNRLRAEAPGKDEIDRIREEVKAAAETATGWQILLIRAYIRGVTGEE